LSKFAIVKAPAVLAVGVAPFVWTPVSLRRATRPNPRDRADHRLAIEGDSKWLKVP
jgi:hypothetical protein